VKKKALLTVAFISVLLLSAVAGTQLVNLGKANPFSQSMYSGEMHSPVSATPPSIMILHPEDNKTYNENFVNLTLYAVVGQTPYSLEQTPYHPPLKIFHGLSLTEVYYEADWLENKTVVNGTSEFTYVYNSAGTSDNFYDNFYGQTTGSYSCSLTLEDIPEGNHIITVKATERGYYYYVEGGISFAYYGYSISAISSVSFTVDTVPTVSFLSFENRTFETSDVPLNFTVNQVVSKIAYCLDGQENLTISGNTTLTELPNGEHNITVYATDETGNTGASETIIFNVAKPEPPAPFPTTMVIAPIASVGVMGVGLLVYFKKRKR
jgi:hypothetical protein